MIIASYSAISLFKLAINSDRLWSFCYFCKSWFYFFSSWIEFSKDRVLSEWIKFRALILSNSMGYHLLGLRRTVTHLLLHSCAADWSLTRIHGLRAWHSWPWIREPQSYPFNLNYWFKSFSNQSHYIYSGISIVGFIRKRYQ